MLITTADKKQMNELMYQVAVYNFSRFMIKDFDLITTPLDSAHTMLSITNLESYDEAKWYDKALVEDQTIAELFNKLDVQTMPISEENFKLLQAGATMEKYLVFETKIKNAKNIATVNLINENNETAIAAESAKNQAIATPEQKSAVATAKPTETVEIKVIDLTKPDDKAENLQNISNPQPEIKPKEPPVEYYKDIFAIEPNAPHFIAFYIINGKIDFEKIQTEFNKYNAENYGLMNLKVSQEKTGKNEFVLVGNFTNAETAKSYLLRIIKEKPLFEGFKGTSYRNLIGTQRNLNTMVQRNALNIYMEYMKEYILK
jgi:hypothetical protein